MAKIRVYELAKDLNMTNRELLDKIIDLNIEISSHMSSLDDESVMKIKSKIFGTLDDKIDEKRVKPTVIRRRRKLKKLIKNINSKETIDNLDEKCDKINNNRAESLYLGKNKLKKMEIDSSLKLDKKNDKVVLSVNKFEENENSIEEEKKLVRIDDSDEIFKVVSNLRANNFVKDDTIKNSIFDGKLIKNKNKDSKIIIKEKSLSGFKRVPHADKKHGENFNNFSFEESAPNATEAKVLEDENIRMSSNQTKTTERSSKETSKVVKKNKTWKSVSGRMTRKKEVPAKIIKKPSYVNVESSITSKDPRNISLKHENKLKKEPILDSSGRKPFRKKIFKKKEMTEGKDIYSSKKKGGKFRRRSKSRVGFGGQKTQITVAKAIKRRIKVDETIVLSNLAKRLGVKASEMIGKLMTMGVMVTVNQTIDFDTATLVATEFNYEVEKASFEEDLILKKEDKDDPSKKVKRPPVVTIMGHVDHGKTSLLDAIRETRVTEGEAGGITQHIGAYRVETKKGVIAFLDTPGHEAFSAMRSRGAKVTDIVVLVVAADDGVMPQTIEAINHSKASKVPIIVAINKMDKIEANPERVLRELSDHGLVTENWGGDVISVQVSAKENTGLGVLLEMILLQAEMLELRANPDKLAKGHVVESRLDSGRGPVATVLVQEGTLRSGSSIICGMHYGKVRALQDDIGQKVEEAGPSMPVEIIGLSGVPMAGDELIALEDEKDARQVSLHRIQKQRSKELAKTNRLSLEGLFERMQKGELKDLNLIVKADVDGSIEALKDSLTKLSNNEVSINIVHSATGTITESDVSLAAVSNAVIIGFNVRPNSKVQDFASDENVDMRFYDVIYNVIKDIKGAIVGMMESTYEERMLGRATVRQVFHVPKIGTIAGSYVTDGKLIRGNFMRLLRDGVIIYQGKNGSLRRFKDDVKEVQGGYECGIGIEKFNDIKVGDVIESYYMEEIKPNID